jgi:hypothetical protein
LDAAQQIDVQVAEQTLSSDVVPNSLNTINTTLDDTGTRLVAQVTQSVVTPVFPLPDQTPERALERMVQIEQFTWATSDGISPDAPFQTITPMAFLLQAGINDCVCSYFLGVRADMEIHFRVNSNQFYAGALMITVLPDQDTFYEASASLIARSWNKPKVISAQCQDTVVVQLPWLRPERWLQVEDLTVDSEARIIPWTIHVDIISPLRAAFAAADSLTVQVSGRLVNPQVVWPYTTTESRHKFRHQSGRVTPRVTPPKKPASRVHFHRGGSDPVEDAKAQAKSASASVSSTISSAIDAVAAPVESVLSAIQPLTSLFEGLLAFDKPELQSDLNRMIPLPEADYTQSDRKTWALPLTLHDTSYLATGGKVPDGGAWTWAKLAMTPCLTGFGTFNNTTTTSSFLLLNPVSPLAFAMSQHLYYHTSYRVHFSFYAPTFVSGRLLINFFPNGAAVPQQIDSNITRIIDVKGDTTVQMTIPWINPTDYRRTVDEGKTHLDVGFGQITISVYNPIVTSDASTDANIDMVMWLSAGPDCQFACPYYTGQFFNALPPPTVFRPQCDIQEAFQRTFPPIIENCSIYTDQHFVQSEVSDRLVDVMKRFQTASFTVSAAGLATLSAFYSPAQLTVGWAVKNCFIFHRGGTLYKSTYQSSSDNFQTTFGVAYNDQLQTQTHVILDGKAGFFSSPQSLITAFAVPWFFEYPYTYIDPVGYSINSAIFEYHTSDTVPPTLVFHTAVRDDYEMGYLICPNLTTSAKRARKSQPAAKSGKQEYNKLASQPVKTSLGRFMGL